MPYVCLRDKKRIPDGKAMNECMVKNNGKGWCAKLRAVARHNLKHKLKQLRGG